MVVFTLNKVHYTPKAYTTSGRDSGARPSDGRLDGLQTRFKASRPVLDRELAQAIMNVANETSPFSNATHGSMGTVSHLA
jgi:organic hydroperoxide reductase OsmC/OhrA